MAEELRVYDRTVTDRVLSEQPEHFQRVKRILKHNRRTSKKRKNPRDRVSVAEIEA